MDGAYRVDDLGNTARMEQLLVEALGLAVIPEIEPKDFEARREQCSAGRKHVTRMRAALPAMQKHDEAAARARGPAVVPEQARASAAFEQLRPRRRDQGPGAAAYEPPP